MTYHYFSTKNAPSIHFHLDQRILYALPDQLINEFEVKRFDETGLLQYALYAQSAYHIPHEQQHYLTYPLIQGHIEEGPHWTLSAKSALSKKNGELITFNKKTHLIQDAFKKYPASELMTEQLIYSAKKNMIYTSQSILWKQNKNRVYAQGLCLHLATQTLELNHHVKAALIIDTLNTPINITAGKATYDQKKHHGHYSDGMTINHKNYFLDADSGDTLSNSHTEILSARVKGHQNKQAYIKIKAPIKENEIHGYADQITYFPPTKKIELIGNVCIHQGKAVFCAPKLVYDIQKEHMMSETLSPQTQTTLIFPKHFSGQNTRYEHLIRPSS